MKHVQTWLVPFDFMYLGRRASFSRHLGPPHFSELKNFFPFCSISVLGRDGFDVYTSPDLVYVQ